MPNVMGRKSGSAVNGPIPGKNQIINPSRDIPTIRAIFCH